MRYQPPYKWGATPAVPGIFNDNADAAYINGNPTTGTPGSNFPGEALEHPQRELIKGLTSAGITPDVAILEQVAEAMARYASLGTFGTGGGTANAQTVTKIGAAVVPKAYFDGMQVMWNPTAVNSTAATLNAFGIGAKSIADMAGNALTGGELQPPCVARYSLSADKFLLMPWSGLQFSFSSLRGRLAASQTPTLNTFTTMLMTTSVLPPWATLASGVYTLTRAGTYHCVATLGHNNANATGWRIIRERSGVLEGIAAASHTTGGANNALNCGGILTDGQIGDKIYAQAFEGTTNPAIPTFITANSSNTYTELTIARIAN